MFNELVTRKLSAKEKAREERLVHFSEILEPILDRYVDGLEFSENNKLLIFNPSKYRGTYVIFFLTPTHGFKFLTTFKFDDMYENLIDTLRVKWKGTTESITVKNEATYYASCFYSGTAYRLFYRRPHEANNFYCAAGNEKKETFDGLIIQF